VTFEDVVVYGLIALALLCVLVASAGLLSARTAFDRLHFVAPATLAAILFAGAVFAREGPSLIAIKGGLLVAVLLVGAPLTTHAIARSARIAERGDWREEGRGR
jgi:multisubunit Na+/H+ antiporter MnhG subunit